MMIDIGKCKTILVVDDDPDCADSLAMMLEMYGHTILVAYDGLAAIELANEKQPSVAIVDITMPRLNGISVAHCLRRNTWCSPLKLIAISGWSHRELREAALAAGFESYFVKPINPAKLIAAIESSPAAFVTPELVDHF